MHLNDSFATSTVGSVTNMRKLVLLLSITTALNLSACSLVSVYKIDIPQGTPLTQAQVNAVHVGMSQAQVQYLLGSPAINDTLEPNRWDYVYTYVPGTYAKKEGLSAVKAGEQVMSVFFDGAGSVERIEGQKSVPINQPGLPGSKDASLYSDGL